MIGSLSRLFSRVQHTLFGGLSSDHRAGLFGVGWSTLSHMLSMVLKLGSTLVLSRLLTPEIYGVMGTVFAVITITEMFCDIGLGPALVRHPKGGTAAFLGTAWWISFYRGLLLSVVIFVASFILPGIYNNLPQLGPILAVMALGPIIRSFYNPNYWLLQRELRYSRISIVEILRNLLGILVAIAVAYVHRSEWAIVAGALTVDVAFIVLSFVVAPWPVWPRWNRAAGKELSGFGRQIYFNTLFYGFWVYLDRLLGPRVITSVEVMGLYITAWNLAENLERLVLRVCEVYYSMLARLHDYEERRQFQRSMNQKLARWGMPLMALCVCISPILIRILYDSRYQGARILLAILAARLMLRVLCQLQFMYLMVRAEVYLATRCYFVAILVLLVTIFPLAGAYGVTGLAVSVLLSTALFALAQTLILVWQREIGIFPFLATLGWTAIGLAGAVGVDRLLQG